MTDLLLFLVMIGGMTAGMILIIWWSCSRGFAIFDGLLDGLTLTQAREKATLERLKEKAKAEKELQNLRDGKEPWQ